MARPTTFLFLMILLPLLTMVGQEAQNSPRKRVLVMEIKAEIDPRMHRYVNLALDRAEEIDASHIVIELDTYGGTLTDAKEIAQRIMDEKRPVWVFINSDAASAGALISIACDSIYMSPGASIGAATVVTGGTQEAAPDKYQSYMRSIMRSTAEENGRRPDIAEGMVDERVVVDSIKQAGKVITLTTSEAIAVGYCEGKVDGIEEIMSRNGVTDYELEIFRLGFTEKIIAFVLNPFISGLLILIIIAGIYFEMQAPGIGFASLAALVALVLYLVPYYLNGLAAYWEILALLIGIILIGLEIFVIPGFGVAGISGIVITLGSLGLIMLNNDYFNFEFVPLGDITVAFFSAIGGVAGAVLVLIVVGPRLTESAAFRRVALMDTQKSSEGFSVQQHSPDMNGKRGVAYTVLRPSGKIMIENVIYDAFTRGEFIERGETIEVVSTEGVSLKVKKV